MSGQVKLPDIVLPIGKRNVSLPPINKNEALKRINECPVRLMDLDEAYYLLYGSVRRGTAYRKFKWWFQTAVVDGLLELIRWDDAKAWVQAFFGDGIVYDWIRAKDVPPEDVPDGIDPDEVVIPVDSMELFLRRCRTVKFCPEIGVELFCYDVEGVIRIAPVDLANYLLGDNPVNWEAGEYHLWNSCRTAIGPSTEQSEPSTDKSTGSEPRDEE